MESKCQTYYGYRPFEHQKAVHRLLNDAKGTGRIVVVKSRRQCGKSVMIENELLRYAVSYGGTTSICLSPTLAQARKIFKELTAATYGSPIRKGVNNSRLEIELMNGSSILFKSAEQGDNLRGYTVTGILCLDEVAYISDEVFYTVLPWCDVHRSPILMVSTPKIKDGVFFRYFTDGLYDHSKGIYSVDWNDYDLSMLLTFERLEMYRKMLPKVQFTTEYLGEFADTEGMVFTDFKKCVGKPSKELLPVYMGIDWGTCRNEDYTAISVFNSLGELVELQYWNNHGNTSQVKDIAKIIGKYGDRVQIIQPEDNSIGNPYTDLLKQALDPHTAGKIKAFTTTNESKSTLVTQTQVAFEQGTIKLLDDNMLMRQLSSYEATYSFKTGKVSYNGAAGTHDDLVMAIMLGFDAYHKRAKAISATNRISVL